MTNNINKAKQLITNNLICSKQIIITKRLLLIMHRFFIINYNLHLVVH